MKTAVDWGNKESINLEKQNLDNLKTKGATVSELSNNDSFKVVRDELYTKYSSNALIKELIQENQNK